MQRFVPPVFGPPDQQPDRSVPGRPYRVRWGLVVVLGAVVLGITLSAYSLTAALLDGIERPLHPIDAHTRAPALVMAVLACGAALGVIALAQQVSGFLLVRQARREAGSAFPAGVPDQPAAAVSMADSLQRQRLETARLLAVLESIPYGVVVQDLDGRVVMINDAARGLLGSQRAFRAARLHELPEAIRMTLGPALAPGIYALGDPSRVPLEDKMLQAQAAALMSARGVRLGTVVLIRDVTAEVERERARAELLDQLSEQVAAPGPLHRYPSLAALAREVTRNTRSVQQVIAALQDLSTFEPRDLATDQRPLALNDLLGAVTREWQPLAQAAGIRLRVKFAPHGYYVLGDERRLRWALGNVIDNAIKYSPAGTAVLIAGRVRLREPAAAEVAIEDQGFGIAADDLPQVFARFYRGTPRNAQGVPIRRPGTGQGLYIAQRVIKAHGGAIAIASQPQRGTTVSMTLPLTAPVTLSLPEADETVRHPGIVDPVDLDDTRHIPVLSLLPTDREVDLL